ncbi:MAG: alpha/beta hydrolase [Actinobacteria bacterium]|nr:alpha/beta hydrolase [Actinomycetota bacterium]
MTGPRSAHPVPLAVVEHGVEHGTGPLVVLLHELAEDHRAWDPVVDRLEGRARVLTVDLRGHGASPAGDGYDVEDHVADLRAVLAARDADAQPPLLVGHGYGAFVAMDYATWFPTAGVVDVDQHLLWSGSDALVRALPAEPAADDVERVLLYPSGYGPLGEDEQARLRALRRADPQVLAGMWQPLRERDPVSLRAWAEQVVAVMPGTPVLCVLGADPGRTYVSWLREHARATRIEGWSGGHYPHLVDPDRFVARLLTLLALP